MYQLEGVQGGGGSRCWVELMEVGLPTVAMLVGTPAAHGIRSRRGEGKAPEATAGCCAWGTALVKAHMHMRTATKEGAVEAMVHQQACCSTQAGHEGYAQLVQLASTLMHLLHLLPLVSLRPPSSPAQGQKPEWSVASPAGAQASFHEREARTE